MGPPLQTAISHAGVKYCYRNVKKKKRKKQ